MKKLYMKKLQKFSFQLNEHQTKKATLNLHKIVLKKIMNTYDIIENYFGRIERTDLEGQLTNYNRVLNSA